MVNNPNNNHNNNSKTPVEALLLGQLKPQHHLQQALVVLERQQQLGLRREGLLLGLRLLQQLHLRREDLLLGLRLLQRLHLRREGLDSEQHQRLQQLGVRVLLRLGPPPQLPLQRLLQHQQPMVSLSVLPLQHQ